MEAIKSSSRENMTFTGLQHFIERIDAQKLGAVKLELAAEAAADIRCEHADVTLAQAEHAGEERLVIVGGLG